MQSTTVVDQAVDALVEMAVSEAEREPSLDDPEFDRLDYAGLARELARKIHPPAVVTRRYGLSDKQLMLLLQQPSFLKLVRMERAAWEGSDNAGERARQYHREAQAIFASDIAAMVMNESMPAALRLEAAKLSSKIAGLDGAPREMPGGVAPGSGFAVNIVLGDGRDVSIATTMLPPAPAPALEGVAE